jgi:hypothetical protein
MKDRAVENSVVDVFQKILDRSGASFSNSSTVKSPNVVSNRIMMAPSDVNERKPSATRATPRDPRASECRRIHAARAARRHRVPGRCRAPRRAASLVQMVRGAATIDSKASRPLGPASARAAARLASGERWIARRDVGGVGDDHVEALARDGVEPRAPRQIISDRPRRFEFMIATSIASADRSVAGDLREWAVRSRSRLRSRRCRFRDREPCCHVRPADARARARRAFRSPAAARAPPASRGVRSTRTRASRQIGNRRAGAAFGRGAAQKHARRPSPSSGCRRRRVRRDCARAPCRAAVPHRDAASRCRSESSRVALARRSAIVLIEFIRPAAPVLRPDALD